MNRLIRAAIASKPIHMKPRSTDSPGADRVQADPGKSKDCPWDYLGQAAASACQKIVGVDKIVDAYRPPFACTGADESSSLRQRFFRSGRKV
jgi:hypothetical protein